MMEHSTSYTSFVNLINNTNSFARVNGIPGNLLVEIYDWERDDVENIIWNRFIKMNDMDMTYYLPRLKREVSIEEIEKKLTNYSIPSRQNVQIAYTLYRITANPKYLQLVKSNIVKKNERTSYVAIVLQDCDPKDSNIYSFLRELFIEEIQTGELVMVIDGLFFCKGIMKKMFSIEESNKCKELFSKYFSQDVGERKKLIIQFENEFGI